LAESKKLVTQTMADLSKDHCPDCGAGNVQVTFRLRQATGLEYYTKCGNCGKEQVF
jgi:ribosomal protein S27E